MRSSDIKTPSASGDNQLTPPTRLHTTGLAEFRKRSQKKKGRPKACCCIQYIIMLEQCPSTGGRSVTKKKNSSI